MCCVLTTAPRHEQYTTTTTCPLRTRWSIIKPAVSPANGVTSPSVTAVSATALALHKSLWRAAVPGLPPLECAPPAPLTRRSGRSASCSSSAAIGRCERPAQGLVLSAQAEGNNTPVSVKGTASYKHEENSLQNGVCGLLPLQLNLSDSATSGETHYRSLHSVYLFLQICNSGTRTYMKNSKDPRLKKEGQNNGITLSNNVFCLVNTTANKAECEHNM